MENLSQLEDIPSLCKEVEGESEGLSDPTFYHCVTDNVLEQLAC